MEINMAVKLYREYRIKFYLNMRHYIIIDGKKGEIHPHTWEFALDIKNARKLVEAAEVIPMERILLETDCPYLAPVPNRGKRNDSSNIRYVIEKLAEIKKMSYDEIVDITNNNARRLFFKEA
jgi:6-pyruvoyl-tetrahydropterin synthase